MTKDPTFIAGWYFILQCRGESSILKQVGCIAVSVCLCLTLVVCDNSFGKEQGGIPPRFIVNGGTVIDQQTKLMWRRCSIGAQWLKEGGCSGTPVLMTLTEAKKHEKNAKKGWRLPNIQELCTLIDSGPKGVAINTDLFPDLKGHQWEAPYWTITRVDDIPRLFYFVDFFNGIVDGHSEGFPMAVRLVRDCSD